MQTTPKFQDINYNPKHLKRIAVIGGGASGLVTLKSLLEVGLNAICFEKSDAIGGVWNFREEIVPGLPSIMRSTVANTSKEMTAFSDFPPPNEYPDFMPREFVANYLQNYAIVFGLMERVLLEHQVVFMTKTRDHEVTGRWLLSIFHDGEIHEELFDGVVICTGLYTYPNIPEMPGLNRFMGQVIHSHDYKDPDSFKGKNVLLVGLGNSSADIAVELSSYCNTVCISVRRKTKVYPRTCHHGIPFDFTNTRWHHYLFYILPKQLFTVLQEYKTKSQKVEGYKETPKEDKDDLNLPSILNDQLITCIENGTVTVRGGIDHFSYTGVVFKEEPGHEYLVDSVILATGYLVEYPFYPNPPFLDDKEIRLYKNVFPIGLCKQHYSCLAIIGLFRVVGASFPVAEMQARWVAKVFQTGKGLPSSQIMWLDMLRQHREASQLRSFLRYQSLVINFLPYMDELASFIGCRPNLFCMAFTDPRLFRVCYWGPLVAYQYRLQGPHMWSGARDAILRVNNRLRQRFLAGAEVSPKRHNSVKKFWEVYSFAAVSLLAAFTCFHFL